MLGLLSWVALSVLMGVSTLWAVWSRAVNKWRTYSVVGFVMSTVLAGGVLLLSQGWSSPCFLLLPGKYSILTYQIIPYDRIYLFLDTAYGPKSCYISWTNEKADELDQGREGPGFDFNITWSFGGIPGMGDPNGELVEGDFSERPAQPEHPTKPEEPKAQF